MSERNKTHNGRDRSGHFKVKQADLEELAEDPEGQRFIRDDVRLGGAIADVGMTAGQHGKEIEGLVRNSHTFSVMDAQQANARDAKPKQRSRRRSR